MARRRYTAIGVGLVVIGLTTTLPGQTPPTLRQAIVGDTGEKVSEISTEVLEATLATGSAIILDARPYAEFAVSHIPGAANVAPKPGVPMSMYVSDVAEIGRLVGNNKAAPLVIYCNGPHCGKSKRLAGELANSPRRVTPTSGDTSSESPCGGRWGTCARSSSRHLAHPHE